MSEKEWMEIFGNNLRELMAESGYTRKELAKELDIAQSSLWYYLNGKKMPSVRVVLGITYLFDVSLDDLIDFGAPIK